jgi:hypothetical protein
MRVPHRGRRGDATDDVSAHATTKRTVARGFCASYQLGAAYPVSLIDFVLGLYSNDALVIGFCERE